MSLKDIRQEITDELSECNLDPITYRDHGGESVGDLVRVCLFSAGEHLIYSSSNTFSMLDDTATVVVRGRTRAPKEADACHLASAELGGWRRHFDVRLIMKEAS